MGIGNNVDFDKFPKQGLWLEKKVRVIFFYRGTPIMGTIVRDDIEDPYLTIIKLDDGRYVLSTECQYSPVD